MSIALRLDFGAFSYYSGGDVAGDTYRGAVPWLDMETPVAQICGRVEVAVANHHGVGDACGPGYAKFLAPQVVVIPAPGPRTRVPKGLKGRLGAGCELFGVGLKRRCVEALGCPNGHVVVRVSSDALSFDVFVLDNSSDSMVSSARSFRCRAG